MPKARRGYSRDDNSLPLINIGLVATKNKGLPILFRTYEGNITDVRTVEQLILRRVHLRLFLRILVKMPLKRSSIASKTGLICSR
jgi:hypothetical protein